MDITVSYQSIDDYSIRKTYRTLKGAQEMAQYWVGKHPEIGSTYAVSSDGIGRIMVKGCALRDLFPEA